jgi:hypothetical protein
MNKYFKDLLRTTSIHAIAITFLVWTLSVFALGFPSSTPTWETAWWLFMDYFGKILVNSWTTTDWTVKKADTTDGYHLNQAVTSGANTTWGTVNADTVRIGTNAYTYITLEDDESPNWVKYIHANSNNIWFLSGAGAWLSRWDDSGNQINVWNITALGTVNANMIRVGAGTSTHIVLEDDESPNWVKYIHANGNNIGFLSGAGAWLSRWDNSGNQVNVWNITAPKVTGSSSLCIGGDCKTSWPSPWKSNVGLNNCSNITVGDGQLANCGSKVMVAAAAFWQNQLSVTCCAIYLY